MRWRCFKRSSEVTILGSVRMSPKPSISPQWGSGRSSSKQMVACFFGKTGQVATVPLGHRRTVNSERYTTICLPKLFGEIRKANERRAIIFLHGNASSHTSAWRKLCIYGSSVVQPWLRSQWLLSIFAHQEKYTIFVTRRYCWSFQEPCFGDVSLGVENHTKIMVVFDVHSD